MRTSSHKSLKTKILNKIQFLEDRLASLDHFLPDTYQFLLSEIDQQKLALEEIEINEFFQEIDADESTDKDTRPIGY